MKQSIESTNAQWTLVKTHRSPQLVSGIEELRQLHSNKQYPKGWARAADLLKQYPNCTEILGFMILFAKNNGQYSLALGLALSHLQRYPHDYYLTYQLGMLYYTMQQFDKALYFVNQAFALDKNNTLIGGNLAILYFEHGDFDLAIQAYQHQIDIHTKDVTMPFGQALAMLAKGDYTHGWPAYESRFHLKDPDCRPVKLDTPIWDGKTDIRGKSLMVTWEQGNGDNIQFVRFLALLKQKTQATIIYACLPTLLRLFKHVPGIDILIPENLRITHDYQASIQSLPLLLGISKEEQLLPEPYLKADLELISIWKNKIADNETLKVGICWSGGKDYMHDTKRTLKIHSFISLFSDPTISLYSLQKIVSVEDADILMAGNIPNLGQDFIDFADTAAAIASLDLVITVDTAVAHLAAAMGKPTWVLLRYETEWRHPRNREISTWYTCMRLFRQLEAGDWEGILVKVREALHLHIQHIKHQDNAAATTDKITVPASAETEQPISIVIPSNTGRVTERDMLELNQLFFTNQYEDCLARAKSYVKRDPACLGALVTIARAAIALGQLNLAFGILYHRLKNEPNNPLTHYLLGSAYKKLRDYDKTLIHMQRAIELEPNNIIYCESMAKTNFDMGNYQQAITYYSRVNAIQESSETGINLSLTMLADKKYHQGWLLYENRFRLDLFTKEYVQSPMPFWNGKTDIANKKLLLIWEQGVGDVIQFMRFIPLLKEKTHAHICFVCGPNLLRIAKKITGVDMVHVTTDLPVHDYKVYLLSLPLLFGLFKEEQFLTSAYIKADNMLAEKWRQKLPSIKPYKVGICWMGGGKYSCNAERNCTLSQFVKLIENSSYQIISLQKDISREEKEMLNLSPIINISDELADFAETAAVIANLDLVIAVDTAIAHLAGAMGKPVWVLIRYETEWRHPRDTEQSPWYKSMRLFRQPKPGDWDSVFTLLTEALATLFSPKEKPHE